MRAMQAIISNDRTNPFATGNQFQEVAREAYSYADAMLAERERTKGSKVDKELQE
jgi:hypothetical protein